MSFISKLKKAVGDGISHMKEKRVFKRKQKKKDNGDSPEISDVDRAIAKIKSEKRSINEQIRKVVYWQRDEC